MSVAYATLQLETKTNVCFSSFRLTFLSSFDDEIKVWDLKNLRFKKYLYLDIGTIIDLKFNSKNMLVISNINKEIIERDLVNNNNNTVITIIITVYDFRAVFQ